jgi:hypothetical protein
MHPVPDALLPSERALSIALTAIIAPSRRLRALLWLAALVHAGTAAFLHIYAARFALPWLLVTSCCFAAALCTAAALRPVKVRQIDISKTGALRLTVQQNLPDRGHAARLLPGSVLWGWLLVLRISSIDDATSPVQTVLVLPDSTDPETFRALVVAMGSIAGRDSAAAMQKIL